VRREESSDTSDVKHVFSQRKENAVSRAHGEHVSMMSEWSRDINTVLGS
jgi:hypothetical protein